MKMVFQNMLLKISWNKKIIAEKNIWPENLSLNHEH